MSPRCSRTRIGARRTTGTRLNSTTLTNNTEHEYTKPKSKRIHAAISRDRPTQRSLAGGTAKGYRQLDELVQAPYRRRQGGGWKPARTRGKNRCGKGSCRFRRPIRRIERSSWRLFPSRCRHHGRSGCHCERMPRFAVWHSRGSQACGGRMSYCRGHPGGSTVCTSLSQRDQGISMAHYVDGFVIPLPRKNVDDYRRGAQKAGKIWRAYGALEFREWFGDDLNVNRGKPILRRMQSQHGETVGFSSI